MRVEWGAGVRKGGGVASVRRRAVERQGRHRNGGGGYGARQEVGTARGDLESIPPAVAAIARLGGARARRGHA